MTSTTFESLSHSRWECKYHVVFVPKWRKKILYGKIREYLAKIFHELANQKGCKIIQGNMVQDHVHMLISIPPKYSVSQIMGYIKGKSAIAVARQFGGKQRNFNGEKAVGSRICCFHGRV
jgi:putative transposase